jgi:hypothetical protein
MACRVALLAASLVHGQRVGQASQPDVSLERLTYTGIWQVVARVVK